MLDRRHRLTSSAEFSSTTRRGRRAGSATLVVHLSFDPAAAHPESRDRREWAPRVGFVVARSVGTAVTRNRVRRRLRHLARERIDRLPAGTSLVVRALPSAASSSYATLGRDLDSALRRASVAAPSRRGSVTGTGRLP